MYSYGVSLISFFCLSITVVQAADGQQPPDENQQWTQMSINQAAYESSRKADSELNRLFQKLVASEENPKRKARLREAQRAWIVFRDKSCLYQVGLPSEGGSIEQMEYANCLESVTLKRIKDFEEYLK